MCVCVCVCVCVCPCRQLFDYDQVVNTQRDKVYAERRRALLAEDLAPIMVEYAEKTSDDILQVRGCDTHTHTHTHMRGLRHALPFDGVAYLPGCAFWNVCGVVSGYCAGQCGPLPGAQ